MKQHYEWLVAGLGAVALLGALAFFALTDAADEESAVAEVKLRVERMKPAKTEVAEEDMAEFASAVKLVKNPASLATVAEDKESFLASEVRVKCKKCQKVIGGDVKKFPKCPFCGEEQEVAVAAILDADKDGLPDDWERKYGLNPASAADADEDKDGDGFTNFEEFEAKTDPTDAKSHPDYLDSLAIVLPLKETYVPFVFREAQQIPAGWRLKFFDPDKLNGFGKKGVSLTALVGEEIADSDKTYKPGYIVKNYEAKTARVPVPGAEGLTQVADVSEATLERIQDHKIVKLVAQPSGKTKTPIDVQATLTYTRGEVKTFEVISGSEIALNGQRYRVLSVKPVGDQAEVTLEDVASGKKRTLKTLE